MIETGLSRHSSERKDALMDTDVRAKIQQLEQRRSARGDIRAPEKGAAAVNRADCLGVYR